MESNLIHALTDGVGLLQSACLPEPENPASNASPDIERIAAKTATLVQYLARIPHAPAREVARELEMDRDEIILAYKLVQRTKAAADVIRSSPNRDYLNIVKHYFLNKLYVVVFFTGLACPGRCCFCPNVTVREDGSRHLSVYGEKAADRMSFDQINTIFEDISTFMEQGTSVLVKISGGLEPLTDTENMSIILDKASARNIHVKLFTNGMLLDSSERRELALRAGDVRISLNMIDEAAYADAILGNDPSQRSRYGLSSLLDNLRNLIRERNFHSPTTRIGLNTIVLEENHLELDRFVSLTEELGLDYIDFKPNYFSTYREKTQEEILETVDRIKGSTTDTEIYFAASLSAENLFWQHREGECSPDKQSQYKMFITPHGICSPVHHGAFPTGKKIGENQSESYTIGRISSESSLLYLIDHLPPLPGLAYDKLNPFEHMLALEIEREEQDRAWGIPDSCNPYDFAQRDIIPPEVRGNPLLHGSPS